MAVDVGAVRARNAERQRQVDTGSTPAQIAGAGQRVRDTGSRRVVLNESGQPIRVIEEGRITEISQSPAAQQNSVSPPRTRAVQQGGLSFQQIQQQQLIRQGVAPHTALAISRAQQLALLSPGIASEIQRRREAGIDIPTEEALLNRRFARGGAQQQYANGQVYDQYVSSPSRFVEFRENLINNNNLAVVRENNNGSQTNQGYNNSDIGLGSSLSSRRSLLFQRRGNSSSLGGLYGASNISSSRPSSPGVLVSSPKQEEQNLFLASAREYPYSAGRLAISPVKGVAKLFYLPNRFGGRPLLDIGQDKLLRTKGSIYLDEDVQNLAFTGAAVGVISGAALISPIAATGAGLGFLGYSGVQGVRSIVTGIKSKNPKAISEGAATATVPFLIGGAIKGGRSVLPRYEVVRFNAAGESFNIKTLSYENQGRSLVLGTQTPEGFSVGTPKIKNPIALESLSEAVAAPRTAGATKVLTRVLETSAPERIRIKAIQEQLRLSGKEKGLTVQDVFFNLKVLRNRRVSSAAIESAIAQEQGVVFGSATTQQLPKGFRLTPGDVDVVFPKRTEAQIIKGFIPELTQRLRARGERVRISKDNALIIETFRGEKVIEAKSGVDPSALSGPEIANVGGLGFDFGNLRAGQVTSTVAFGKARAITAGEQLSRKGVASAFFRGPDAAAPESFRAAGVFPKGYRTKDIADFIVQARGIAEIQKQSLNPLVRARGYKAEGNIENLLKTYTTEQQKTIGEIIKVRTKDVSFNFEIKPNKSSVRNLPPGSPRIVGGSPNTTVISSPRNVSSVSIRNMISPRSPSPRSSSRIKYPSPGSPSPQSPSSPRSPSPGSPSPSSPRSPPPGSPSPQLPSPSGSPSSRSPSPRSPSPRSPQPTIPYEPFNPQNMKFPDIKLKLDLRKPKKFKFKGPKLKKGAYLPSLKSVLFNIKGKRPSARQYETGISNRPIRG